MPSWTDASLRWYDPHSYHLSPEATCEPSSTSTAINHLQNCQNKEKDQRCFVAIRKLETFCAVRAKDNLAHKPSWLTLRAWQLPFHWRLLRASILSERWNRSPIISRVGHKQHDRNFMQMQLDPQRKYLSVHVKRTTWQCWWDRTSRWSWRSWRWRSAWSAVRPPAPVPAGRAWWRAGSAPCPSTRRETRASPVSRTETSAQQEKVHAHVFYSQQVRAQNTRNENKTKISELWKVDTYREYRGQKTLVQTNNGVFVHVSIVHVFAVDHPQLQRAHHKELIYMFSKQLCLVRVLQSVVDLKNRTKLEQKVWKRMFQWMGLDTLWGINTPE